MAFVNEPISAEVKATFDFSVFRSMFGGFHKFDDWELRHWVIDTERKVRFLFVESGGGAHFGAERVSRYALWVDGNIAYFDSEQKHEYERIAPPRITWLNSKIILPNALHTKADATVAMIFEALLEMGWGFSKKLNPTVLFSGQPTVIFTTEF